MKWITRERPKIDRIACPWLIKRFVDEEAEFIYAPKDQVLDLAARLNGIAFDIAGAEYSNEGDSTTFDFIIDKHKLEDPALRQLATIIRAANTKTFDLAPQSAGLWAISAGLAYNYRDDYEMLEYGMKIYDALYSWAAFVQEEKHSWDPVL